MRRRLLLPVGALLAATACSGGAGPTSSGADVAPTAVRIDVTAPGTTIDRRLFGVNLPAWAGPERLADPTFRAQVVGSGATVVRMPGGSWSSQYDWVSCEQRDESTCAFSGAARPSDYAAFLAATGLSGMWTVRPDGTAQEAAALVAFFNGSTTDDRPVGIDRNGRDWGTVGQWARLRAEGGTPGPVGVGAIEVGNEVFGAIEGAEGDCASFGWEHVWTCDGTLYAQGDAHHDGFVDFRRAIRAVDPTVAVGAVGVADFGSWSDFGNEVLEATAGAIDFYVIHDYGFEKSPSIEALMERPQRAWPDIAAKVADGLAAHDAGAVPVAVTEYNLVSFEDGDGEARMVTAANAIYIADMIGQLATTGVAAADVWNVVNGRAPNGTDYGMIDAGSGALNPTYDALVMWSSMGDALLPVASGFDPLQVLAAYATRTANGSIAVLFLNKTDEPLTVDVQLVGASGSFDWSATGVAATGVEAESFAPSAPAATVAASGDGQITLPGASITALHLEPRA